MNLLCVVAVRWYRYIYICYDAFSGIPFLSFGCGFFARGLFSFSRERGRRARDGRLWRGSGKRMNAARAGKKLAVLGEYWRVYNKSAGLNGKALPVEIY